MMMMKVGPRFSLSLVSAVFIVLVSLGPSALGQGAAYGRPESASVVLNLTFPAMLALAPEADLRPSVGLNQDDNNKNNGCAAQDKGKNKRSNCTTVPEGGTAFAYLSLVALGCLASAIFRSRQQARLQETK